jgi:hypothetical protein
VSPVVEVIRQALEVLFEPRSLVELRAFKGRLSKFRCGRYTAYKLLEGGAIRSYRVWSDPNSAKRRDHVLGGRTATPQSTAHDQLNRRQRHERR